MAVEYTIYCDGCGSIIHASGRSERAARAAAQLQCGAVSSGGKDWCRSCRIERSTLTPEQRELASSAAHSISTHPPKSFTIRVGDLLPSSFDEPEG